MWIALYINCFNGHFRPHGLFDTKEDAEEYIIKQKSPHLWRAFELRAITFFSEMDQ